MEAVQVLTQVGQGKVLQVVLEEQEVNTQMVIPMLLGLLKVLEQVVQTIV